MHLVTSYAGKEHITAVDQGAFNAALIGTGHFVLGKGNCLEAQVISNNKIRILDGELMMQGRFVRLEPGTYVDLTIDSGTQGYYRNDLIVARYTKDASTGIEDCNMVVIKGTAVTGSPADPAYTKADITNGASTLNDFPLWRIPISGINVGTPEAMFGEPFNESMLTLPEIRNLVNQIHAEVDAKIEAHTTYPVGALYISTDSKSPAEIYGFTWERLKDRFLLAAGDTYAAGSTGGEAEHKLTVAEMPSHTHEFSVQNNYSNGSSGNDRELKRTNTGGFAATYAGGDQPHNNMPPYLAVYVWKRIA